MQELVDRNSQPRTWNEVILQETKNRFNTYVCHKCVLGNDPANS